MSTISSGTTLTTALVQTGDTTGDLVIKTGSSNTTAMTISGSDQSVTLVGSLTANTNASTITTGTVPTARLATGTANSSTYLRGDQTWATVASSQWVTSGSNISYTTGYVGIGTSSPATQLDIKSAAFTDNELTLDNTSSNTTSRVLFKAAGTEYARVAGDSTQLTLQSGNIPTVFRVNSAERMRIDTSGNVGIGTSSPATLEHLSSNTNTQLRIETTNTGSIPVTQYKNAAGNVHQIGSETSSGNAGFNGSSAYALCLEAAGARDICFSANSALRAKITSDGLMQFNSGYGSVATAYGVRAWVDFNGSTGAVIASGNISSVTKNGSGDWSISFINSMPDGNYALAGFVKPTSGQTDYSRSRTVQGRHDTAPAVTYCRVSTVTSGAGQEDNDNTRVIFVR